MIGYEVMGRGALKSIVLNDWICDTSTWAGTRPYLDRDRITWCFADLRGYGRSMGQTGSFTVEEAAADVLELADSQDWSQFAIVGHSMSCLVALHLAQRHPNRLTQAVLLTPPPPQGFGVDAKLAESLKAVGRGDDAIRRRALSTMLGEHLNENWLRFKLERWRACADAAAVEGYVDLFAQRGLPEPRLRTSVPVHAVTGERDSEPLRKDAVRACLEPLCADLTVTALSQCGHYPMQEMPPLCATIVERHLLGD